MHAASTPKREDSRHALIFCIQAMLQLLLALLHAILGVAPAVCNDRRAPATAPATYHDTCYISDMAPACSIRNWHLNKRFVTLQKISAGATILCTAELESVNGRKVWMKSTVSDGPSGKVYATARALFVAPSSTRLAQDAVKMLKDGIFPPDKMGSSM